MSISTFKIGRKEYVVIPRKRYDQLTKAEQDRMDSEVARKGIEAYRSGKMKTISHAEFVKRLGL